MFRRIMIANRGEIAARVVHACRRLGIESVAVFSEADRESPHLREATEALCIGPARSADSYLDMDAILQAALQAECQAIHPGYGFLSENPLFARRCLLQKTTFIGPPPRALSLMGNKVAAKREMRRLGLPIIPGSEGGVETAADAARAAAGIGYPVLLKASAGGGGKGMRIARSEKELLAVFAEAALEAEKAFSDPSLYVERLIEGARHIEFQVLVDGSGRAVHLGERECSLQRAHQKLVEESPSPALGPAERDSMGRRAARALAAAGYVGAGTVEFLRDDRGAFYFMEVNARLQVEHPVTEMVTGIDLVERQIRIAANEPLGLSQEEIRWEGHAVEFRINAEDPDHGFRPDPGRITVWDPPAAAGGLLRFGMDFDPDPEAHRQATDPAPGLPEPGRKAPRSSQTSSGRAPLAHREPEATPRRGPLATPRAPKTLDPRVSLQPEELEAQRLARIRLDSHVERGYEVPPFYDSLLGKLIVHAPDRASALRASERAIGAFRVEGVRTTLPLHARILASPSFRSGDYDLDTLAEVLGGAVLESP